MRLRRRRWTCKKCQWYITLILHTTALVTIHVYREWEHKHSSHSRHSKAERNNTAETRLRTGKKLVSGGKPFPLRTGRRSETQQSKHSHSDSYFHRFHQFHHRPPLRRVSKRKVISETLQERRRASFLSSHKTCWLSNRLYQSEKHFSAFLLYSLVLYYFRIFGALKSNLSIPYKYTRVHLFECNYCKKLALSCKHLRVFRSIVHFWPLSSLFLIIVNNLTNFWSIM